MVGMSSSLSLPFFGGGRRVSEEAAAPALHPEIAQFFTELRRYLGLSEHHTAALLQTDPDVIANLEAGDLSRMPPWEELHRIVTAYVGLAGIDPSAALASLEARCKPSHRSAPKPGRVSAAPSTPRPTVDEPRNRRWPVWQIVGGISVMAIVGLSAGRPMLQAAMTKLPAPLAGVARTANDAVLLAFARKFEGMAWIDVDDPRSRRSDKLRKAAR
jgi:hypothetical protein